MKDTCYEAEIILFDDIDVTLIYRFLKEKMDFSAWFAYALPGPSGNRQFKEPFARPKNTWAYG